MEVNLYFLEVEIIQMLVQYGIFAYNRNFRNVYFNSEYRVCLAF